MTCRLEIVSEHRDLVGEDAVRVFGEDGGTIGRSLQNDWILPDPDRYISGRHATIDCRGGIYYLLDTSSNGVYINGDCEPIGKGNPRRLFNGDTLRLGDFEIEVTIDKGESLVMPLDDPETHVADHSASLVPEESLRTGVKLLDEDAITGDDEFQSAMFGEQIDTSIGQSAVQRAVKDIQPPKHATPKELVESDLVATDLLDSFLDGLGINRAELHPKADLGEVMQNAGEVLREFVDGASQLLASRANLKNAFRLDQTTVLPRHNNPLKLSANTRDSIMQLLVGKEGEYLGPRDAVREVCRDLLFHQDAFLDAMNSAFIEFADRFDPDELKDGFDRTLGRNFLTKFLNKSKYWDLYNEVYPILTEKGGGRFPQMYAEEFVRAYERQIAEYKRLGGHDEHLRETVILSQDDINPDVSANDEDIADDSLNEMLDEDTFVDEEADALVDDDIDTAIDSLDDENDLLADISLDDLPDDPLDEAKG